MTLKDIANTAGVSIATVSRVINGKTQNAASEELKQKIWDIARKGGYSPNSAAQSLKTGKYANTVNRTIACLYARSDCSKDDTFFSDISRSLEKEALKHKFNLQYYMSTNDILETGSSEKINDKHIDGIVVLGRCNKSVLTFLKNKFKNVIYCGLNRIDIICDQVICDSYKAAEAAITFLFDMGHKAVGYIGDINNELRYNAYIDIMNANNQSIYVEPSANSSEAGFISAKKMLTDHPDISSLFCMDDIIAIGAVKAVKECGYNVPKDISVISVDDIEIAQYVNPMLTTVHIPTEEMGIFIARILIDRINNKHTIPVKIELPFSLIKRESVSFCKNSDTSKPLNNK